MSKDQTLGSVWHPLDQFTLKLLRHIVALVG
ncbi:MAG: hypothetical protein ACI9WC_002819, partial [Arenicella sp.]